MLSLLHVAALAGILSVLVQGAVVLDRRQLEAPGPAMHPSTCTDLTTVPLRYRQPSSSYRWYRATRHRHYRIP